MVDVTIRRTVSIPSTAREWELYTSKVGVDKAAYDLTETLRKALQAGKSRTEVECAMNEIMYKHERFGAGDSEPTWVMARTLDRIFGQGGN